MKNLVLTLAFISLFFNLSIYAQTATAPTVGDGSLGSPYQIATLENLYWITATDVVVTSPTQAQRWTKYYIQTADIEASSTSTWNSGAGWSPIGNETTKFTGTYNGNSKTISGLYINRVANGQGFFGSTNGGSISNLGLMSININAGGGNMVGGLVSVTNNTMISNCYSTGIVIGNQFVGGLIGNYYLSSVSSSFSSCNVTGYSAGGGFVGLSSGLIQNCYSTGSVTRKSISAFTDLGGFAGWSFGSNTISKCYSTGRVVYTAATDPTDKGFLGSYSAGTLTGNFWDMETSLQTTTVGTATGKTTAEMKTNTTFLSAGWDYTIWNIGDGINDGYPYLNWQNPSGTPLPVELSSFTATISSNSVLLNWSTATETNNYGFEVQRNNPPLNPLPGGEEKGWVTIGFVNGNGNSNSPKSYFYEDKNISDGKYSYRLKQIDNDGKFEYSKTVEVSFMKPNVFSLEQNYPNPFNPTTTIRYTVADTYYASGVPVRLVVYDVLGNEVVTLVNENKPAGRYEVEFNATGLSSGVYYYRFNSDAFTQTKKFVLMK